LGRHQFLKALEHWWPTHGFAWVFVFAALYVILFFLNDLISPWVGVVDDRVALVFLPAFVRVAAVVVAKLAGLLGLFIGGVVVGLLYGDPPGVALGVSLASIGGILIAYLVLMQAMNVKTLTMSLPVLVVLTVLYAPLNAIVHALAWHGLGLTAGITVLEIGTMMLGDVMGVVVSFFVLRLVTRIAKNFKAPSRA
jgi:hypothetical protein